MPDGSGSPCTNAIASSSAAMYEVRAVITSDASDSDSTVARASSGIVERPGLSAVNSGSVFSDSGLRSMPGCASPDVEAG
ncbi:hypothetical protein D3C72_2466970 [compost metagenome]